MWPVLVQRAAVVLTAAAIGLRFWPAVDWLLVLAGLMMATFAMGRMPRGLAFATFSAYYLAESSPLIAAGSSIMGTELLTSAAWWLFHGLFSSLPILLLRGRAPGLRASLVAFLYIVPPFGTLVPNNPAMVIGLFFPATSIFGAIGFIALAGVIGSFDAKNKASLRNLVLLIFLSLASNAICLTDKTSAPANWHTFDTRLGNYGGDMRRRMGIGNLELPVLLKQEMVKSGGANEGDIWFLAEGMIYDWSPFTEFLWRESFKGSGATAIVGGYAFNQKTHDLTSRVYVLGDSAGHALAKSALESVRAGITFPVVMWRPWGRPNHFPMHAPGNPVRIDGRRVHLSWCYESIIVWPHLLASMQTPDVMVSLENRWATKDTSLEAAQDAAGRLNARWLGVPLMRATNR
ncbi:hypothetical protein Rfer_4489 (plasmid) [Rhodoferax ferrireducens T118]|uniref:Conjugal transfer protein TraB n=2 Tax=Rhodoferax ferrireducens TaxID=192843 RepID=Q21PX1_ALBFT|nr:hypothetical protein Rfer_4489 [Rhodoferax ferrireducens T118]